MSFQCQCSSCGPEHSKPIRTIDLTSPEKEEPPAKRTRRNLGAIEDYYKCPVCLESVRPRQPCATICGHVFCGNCIKVAMKNSLNCPLCNRKLRPNQLLRIYL